MASMPSGRDEPAGAKPMPGAPEARPAANSSASQPEAATRYPPGSKVLFCSGGQGGCVKGTVAKVVSSGGEHSYTSIIRDPCWVHIFQFLVLNGIEAVMAGGGPLSFLGVGLLLGAHSWRS